MNAEDYMAAALAATDAAVAAPEVEIVAAPAPVTAVAAAEAPAADEPEVSEADDDSPVAEAPAASKPEVKPEVKVEAKPSRLEKSYDDIARQQAAIRKDREALAAEKTELASARSLAEAAKRGDAMALLAAAKIPWSKAAKQVLEGHGVEVPDDEEPEADAPTALRQEVDQLKARLAARDAADTQAQFMNALQTKLKEGGDKFKLVAARKAEMQAVRFISDFYNETGRLPGEDFDETMEIALEAVEARLVKERDSWAPLLTSASGAVTVPASKSAVPAGAVSQQAPKTLTNSSGSGPKGAPSNSPSKLKTDEDYIAAALELANNA
jgi:hypothetical protein